MVVLCLALLSCCKLVQIRRRYSIEYGKKNSRGKLRRNDERVALEAIASLPPSEMPAASIHQTHQEETITRASSQERPTMGRADWQARCEESFARRASTSSNLLNTPPTSLPVSSMSIPSPSTSTLNPPSEKGLSAALTIRPLQMQDADVATVRALSPRELDSSPASDNSREPSEPCVPTPPTRQVPVLPPVPPQSPILAIGDGPSAHASAAATPTIGTRGLGPELSPRSSILPGRVRHETLPIQRPPSPSPHSLPKPGFGLVSPRGVVSGPTPKRPITAYAIAQPVPGLRIITPLTTTGTELASKCALDFDDGPTPAAPIPPVSSTGRLLPRRKPPPAPGPVTHTPLLGRRRCGLGPAVASTDTVVLQSDPAETVLEFRRVDLACAAASTVMMRREPVGSTVTTTFVL